MLCQNVTIFYWQELASWQKKMKAYKSLNLNFFSSCFTAGDSPVKVVWLHVVLFSEHDILYFWDNVRLLKYYPVKVPQNSFNSLSVQIKPAYKFPNFRLH